MEDEEEREKLVAEAKALNISGVPENWKTETLQKKIAEAKANSHASESSTKDLAKFAKFNKKGN